MINLKERIFILPLKNHMSSKEYKDNSYSHDLYLLIISHCLCISFPTRNGCKANPTLSKDLEFVYRSNSEGSDNMWRGWLSVSQYATEEFLNMEGEMNQLQQEDVKAQFGGWQEDLTTDLPSGLCTLKPALRAWVAPRDFVAWCLQNSTIECIKGWASTPITQYFLPQALLMCAQLSIGKVCIEYHFGYSDNLSWLYRVSSLSLNQFSKTLLFVFINWIGKIKSSHLGKPHVCR